MGDNDFLEPFNFDENSLVDKSIPESTIISNKPSGLNPNTSQSVNQNKGNANVRTLYNPYTKGYYNPNDVSDPDHPNNYNNTRSTATFDVNAFAEYAQEEKKKDDIAKYYATGGTNVEPGLTSTKTLNEAYGGNYSDIIGTGETSEVDPDLKEKVRLGIVDKSDDN
jgi:2,4-dienoyl-CoA reductase-like NADH-dependent reductase (Old Yellow Enzyme family)